MDTSSEEFKHQCLVRSIIRRRVENRDQAHKDLYGDGKWPGWFKKNPRVAEDVLRQWKLGNRGEQGDWRNG